MREQRIRVLKLAPGEAPQVVELENTLEGLQAAVADGMTDSGMIELVHLPDVDTLLIHEEGKLLNLPANRRLSSFGYMTKDILCGTVYICAETADKDDVYLASLPEDRLKAYAEQFAVPEVIDQAEVERSIGMEFFMF